MGTCIAHLEPCLPSITLLDGTRLPTRLIRAEDDRALQQFHSRLSQQAIYCRFF